MLILSFIVVRHGLYVCMHVFVANSCSDASADGWRASLRKRLGHELPRFAFMFGIRRVCIYVVYICYMYLYFR